MKIVSYNSYGDLSVVSDTGKRYNYESVSPYLFNKLENLIKLGYIGRAWKILNSLTKELENEN